jgi:hypothetical protein
MTVSYKLGQWRRAHLGQQMKMSYWVFMEGKLYRVPVNSFLHSPTNPRSGRMTRRSDRETVMEQRRCGR